MSTGNIHLTSVAVLDLTAGSLRRYRSELDECLRLSEAATRGAHQQLKLLEQRTQRSIASLEEALAFARGQDEPDYTELFHLQSELDDARNRLRSVRHHLVSVEGCIREFSRQHRAMSAYLGHDLPRSLTLLSHLRAHVERYGSSGGLGGFGGSSGSGWGSASLLATQNQLSMEPVDASEHWLHHRGATFTSVTVSPDVTAAIEEHKGPYTYRRLNHWLRYGASAVNPSLYIDEHKATTTTALLDQGFGRFQLVRPVTLLRGLRHTPDAGDTLDLYRNAAAGSLITDKAFISTSLSRPTAAEFGYNGVLLVIYAPRGLTYIPMSTPGDPQQEAELLIPRGSSYLFTNEPGNVREAIVVPPGTSEPDVGTDARLYAQEAWADFVNRYPSMLNGDDG